MTLTFLRLVDGRLWHTLDVADAPTTTCGRGIPVLADNDKRRHERLPNHVPIDAWVCKSCALEMIRRAAIARDAALADPRYRTDPALDAEPEKETDP